MDLATILTILPLLNVLGFVGLGGAYIFTQWKQGANKVSIEVIETYRVQVQQLREELAAEKQGRVDDRHSLSQEVTKVKLDLATMKGALEEKDKKIKEMTDIFQGRDPKLDQYMADMRVFTQGVGKYMKDSAIVLAGMKVFMTQLNNKMGVGGDKNASS